MHALQKKKRTSLICIIFLTFPLFLSFFVTGCEKNNSPATKSEFLLNTIVSVSIYDTNENTEIILDDCLTKCKEYEALFSKTMEGSDVWRINHADGEFVTVSPETLELIQTSLYYSELTEGKIDITIAPVKDLWNFTDSKNASLPDSDILKEQLAHVNYKNIEIKGNSVRLTDADASIDLGFIAKGYIADRLKDELTHAGVESAIINLGGNVLTVGRKKNEPFRVGIQKPFDQTGVAFLNVPSEDSSVVTSGVYERYFTYNGKNYHHILDTKTGYPVENGILSVTILSKDSVTGDALSTTCLVLGLEKSIELIQSLPDVEAIFITDSYEIIRTSEMPDNPS